MGRVEHGRTGRGRRRAGGALSAAILVTACTACGLGEDDDGADARVATPEPRSAPRPARPARGGVLRVVARAAALRLDGTSSSRAVWSLEHVTCNGLLDFPDTGNRDTQAVLQPGVADDLPRVSDDGRTWRFRIREGLRFSDGRELTARDVRATYLRALDPRLDLFDDRLLERHLGRLEGFAAFRGGTADTLDGLRVEGREVTFRLSAPDPGFAYATALRPFCIVPADAPDVHADLPPLTTGPYQVAEHEPGRSARLIRNPEWDANARILGVDETRVDQVDEIRVELGVPADEQLRRLERGDADVSMDLGRPSAGALRRVMAADGLRKRRFVLDDATVEMLVMDSRSGPFRNVRLRQAVNAVLDRRALVAARGGEAVNAAWSHPLPRTLVPDAADEEPWPLAGDLPRARALARGSGVRLPQTVDLVHANRPETAAVVAVLRRSLAAIGLRLRSRAVAPGARALTALAGDVPAAPLVLTELAADVPDAGAFLPELLERSGLDTSETTLRTALGRARVQELGEDRATAWASLGADLVRDAAPVAPLLNRRRLQLVGPRVRGFVWSARGKGIYYGMLSLGER